MKKLLTFLLIIFSVFSFYKTTFAWSSTNWADVFDGVHEMTPTRSGNNLSYDCSAYTSTGWWWRGTSNGLGLASSPTSSMAPCSFNNTGYWFGSGSDDIYAIAFFNSDYSNWGYACFSRTGGNYFDVYACPDVGPPPPPPNGVVSQITPTGSVAYDHVHFTGTYNNDGTYGTLIVTASTGSPAEYSSVSSTITTGTSALYAMDLVLSPNQTYSYTIEMCDYSGYPCLTPTSPVSFTTNGLTAPLAPVWTAEACTWTDFSTWTGCLNNTIHDLFSPTSESVNQFSTLYQSYINKPPFGYVVAIQNALKNINNTSTGVFTLQSMPILNTYIFSPFRVALVWVLWVALTFMLFRRLKDIHL